MGLLIGQLFSMVLGRPDGSYHVAGIPHTPTFMNWAFLADDCDLGKYFSCLSPDVDIIISHGPLYGIHDEVKNKYAVNDKHVGSKTLRNIIEKFDTEIPLARTKPVIKPRILFHGHIHGNKDSVRHTKFGSMDIYNVSVADEDYKVAHKPLVLEF